MFTVNGIPILYNEIDVLQKLRQDMYEKLNIEVMSKIKHTGNNIMICCPFPHSHGYESNPSCGVSTVNNKVHCFACGYIADLEKFVGDCFGRDRDYGVKWLLENFVVLEQAVRPKIEIKCTRETSKQLQDYVTEEELAQYRYYHPYMFQRKLTEEIIEKYDIGYQKDFVFDSPSENKWKPTEVITFPVRDKNGNCLFVSRRSIYGKTFFLPNNIDKPVYGIYELQKDVKEVIICESVINALTCVVYGKQAVALFGTGNQAQINELNKLPVRKYILALDPDKAGFKGTLRLLKGIKNQLLTRYIIPYGKDINDLTKQEFDNLQEVYVTKQNIEQNLKSFC